MGTVLLPPAMLPLVEVITMWKVNEEGEKLFLLGKEAWQEAAEAATACSGFSIDDEDEWVSEEQCSCYNCRYRRWTRESFVCLKPGN